MIELPHFPCNFDKRPLTPRGFYDATDDVDDSSWPLVGIPTGGVSGVDVLDIDPQGVSWFDLNFDALPRTRAHSTRRGVHLLFKHADGLRCSTGKIAKGVDVKADGGYVIWWPREGLPFDDNPICEWPNWLLAEAMKPVIKRDLRRIPVHVGDDLSRLDVMDYRGRDDWLRLMMACHAAGLDREAFINWSTSDPLYANDEWEIGRQWDALKPDGGITPWALRVEVRLAELNKGRCPKHTLGHGRCTSQVPLTTRNLQHRVTAILREVAKGQEPLLFWGACVMREIISEGKLNPDVAVKLLEDAWPGEDARRVIAAGFLTVEDKLEEQ